jgi:hypothetical protein
MLSWLITNIIVALPTWVWIGLAVVGAVLFYVSNFLGFIPNAGPYKLLAKVLGAAALIVGVFMTGGSGVTAVWKSEIEKSNNKVKLAEEKSRQANEQLSNALKTKQDLIHTAQNLIRSQITASATKIDSQCKVDPEAIRILNESAKGPKK